MTYVRIHWRHPHADEPVTLYSELDDNRFEVRKVEVFRNGKYGYADADETSGGTRCGIVPMPELHEITKDSQFEPTEITQEEFEVVWAQRRRDSLK